jgi:hypothetical protein
MLHGVCRTNGFPDNLDVKTAPRANLGLEHFHASGINSQELTTISYLENAFDSIEPHQNMLANSHNSPKENANIVKEFEYNVNMQEESNNSKPLMQNNSSKTCSVGDLIAHKEADADICKICASFIIISACTDSLNVKPSGCTVKLMYSNPSKAWLESVHSQKINFLIVNKKKKGLNIYSKNGLIKGKQPWLTHLRNNLEQACAEDATEEDKENTIKALLDAELENLKSIGQYTKPNNGTQNNDDSNIWKASIYDPSYLTSKLKKTDKFFKFDIREIIKSILEKHNLTLPLEEEKKDDLPAKIEGKQKDEFPRKFI